MAKVLITEQLHPAGPELLRAQGHQVVFFENLGGKTLEEALADADAVLVRISELRGELLKDAKHLKVISKHGVGVDNIDLDYCRGAGIAVTIPRKTRWRGPSSPEKRSELSALGGSGAILPAW